MQITNVQWNKRVGKSQMRILAVVVVMADSQRLEFGTFRCFTVGLMQAGLIAAV